MRHRSSQTYSSGSRQNLSTRGSIQYGGSREQRTSARVMSPCPSPITSRNDETTAVTQSEAEMERFYAVPMLSSVGSSLSSMASAIAATMSSSGRLLLL